MAAAMKPLSVLVLSPDQEAVALCSRLSRSPLVESVVHMGPAPEVAEDTYATLIAGNCPPGGHDLTRALEHSRSTPFILVIAESALEIEERELQALVEAARQPDTAMLYSDFFAGSRGNARPLIDYQEGSIRDDFFFGPLQLYCREKIERALRDFGPLGNSAHAGLYELRLKVSCAGRIRRLARPIGCVPAGQCGPAHFAYVDPANSEHQREMEQIATVHLQRIGALCRTPPSAFLAREHGWPVEASVIIPVRNRCRTIGEAIQSALDQRTSFDFNVLVVDNHSNDGTTDIIAECARKDGRVVHIVPKSGNLGIGGCWNEAVASMHCGRFVCQLDSDDLYSGPDSLPVMIDLLQQGCGMAVGSYRVVDFSLRDIPPGIVDHREWTPENGRNNLLRVQGIGAPRAFATELLRAHPFPDASYGEDYAVALRISRDYRVGRIYEPLYLCRRWEGNTDADIPAEQANRFAFYKDTLRSQEIQARRQQNLTHPGAR